MLRRELVEASNNFWRKLSEIYTAAQATVHTGAGLSIRTLLVLDKFTSQSIASFCLQNKQAAGRDKSRWSLLIYDVQRKQLATLLNAGPKNITHSLSGCICRRTLSGAPLIGSTTMACNPTNSRHPAPNICKPATYGQEVCPHHLLQDTHRPKIILPVDVPGEN